eukprot:TRINITY_DN1015_c0_g1_i1.p1 TRINITY_DN1015_c0_g1~~TRINITY_DN1015_c0_g1_i1.p1  ORF type:complete len:246 (+),score=78.59 TRINITY_DN1015_c0_g1_i1:146-883(+)
MTTAARPTWAPAKGGEEQGGVRMFGPSQKFSSRDLASHTKLKLRKDGQDSAEDLKKRNLRDELEEKEKKHFSSKDKEHSDDRRRPLPAVGSAAAPAFQFEGTKKSAIEEKLQPKAIDADDSDGDNRRVAGRLDSDDEDDDDDEDETAELLAELERIKKERQEEKMRKERQQQEEEQRQRELELARGNPLVNAQHLPAASFSVKRRWDDDVVFRNQARGEPKLPKRFINDTIRSDFHRKFLNKYMK